MHQLDLQAERVKDLPDSAYWQAVEASLELRRQEADAAREYEEGIQHLLREYSKQVRSVIAQGRGGPKKLQKYLAYRKTHTAKLRAARRKMPLTFEGRKEFDDIRRRMVADSTSFVQRLGMEAAQIKSLRKDVRKRREVLFEATIGKGEVVSGAPRKRAKNLTFTPPYSGVGNYVSSFKWKSEPTDILSDPDASIISHRYGHVAATLSAYVKNASDYDSVTLLTRTAMRQWFQMPVAGRVRVSYIFEESGQHAQLNGKIVNEFGESEVDVIQGARMYVQLTSPVVSSRIYLIHWRRRDRDEDNHEWVDVFLDSADISPSGDGDVIISPQVEIPGQFAAGAWVLVDVGIEQYNDFFSNDCEVYTFNSMGGRMLSIGLSSTG